MSRPSNDHSCDNISMMVMVSLGALVWFGYDFVWCLLAKKLMDWFIIWAGAEWERVKKMTKKVNK